MKDLRGFLLTGLIFLSFENMAATFSTTFLVAAMPSQ